MNTTADNLNQDDIQPSKAKLLADHMLETLKEMISSLIHPKFKFAISGIMLAVILFLLSSLFFLGSDPVNGVGFLMSFVIAFLEIYLWFLLGMKVTPKAAHYLVDNKVLKLLFTKGNVHYVEYVPEEKRKIAMPHILNKYIALIIGWVSLSAFLLQIIATIVTQGDPSSIVNPGNNNVLFFIRTLVIFLLVPLIFPFVYPVGWMLVDAKLKAYHSGTKLNWLVGKKVVNLTAGIITIGALAGLGANLLIGSLENIIERVQLIFDLVLFCLINISLTVTLIAVFYNIFFQGAFYNRICESIEIGFGVTSVTLVDENGDPLEKETIKEERQLEDKTEKEELSPTPTPITEPITKSSDFPTQSLEEEPEVSETPPQVTEEE